MASGVGVGMLFASSLEAEAIRGQLVPLNIVEPHFQQSYFFVRPLSGSSPLAELLCDYLKSRWNLP